MQLPATSVMAVFLGLLASANARILLGNTLDNSVMWLEGESACESRDTGKSGENPCGRKVTLSNGQTYQIQGCGGTLYILNNDGTFNSQCGLSVANTDCGVKRTYRCPN